MNSRDWLGTCARAGRRLVGQGQLRRQLLGRGFVVRVWDPRLLSAVERLVHKSDALTETDELQLTLTEAPRRRARRLAGQGQIVLPKFTSFELDSQATRLPKDLSRRWARCPAASDQVSVHRDPAAFDFFYRRLYLPSLTARHGLDAYERSREYLARGYDRGFLLFLSRGNAVVAGALNVMRPGRDIADHWAGGVLDGDPDLVRDGADLALVIRSRQWAERIGARQLGLTQSQPFARDGLFAFKAGFCPRLDCPKRFATVLTLEIHQWSAFSRALVDALGPVSFGVRPTLWHCGGQGLRLPAGLDRIDLTTLAECSPADAMGRLTELARRTAPTRRILRQ